MALGDADHDQVRRFGQLARGGVAAHADDRFAGAVHRVDDPGELGLDDVAEQPAADRVPAPRGAEDGNARRSEERPK